MPRRNIGDRATRLDLDSLRDAHPRLRTDLLRRALRSNAADRNAVRRRLDEWIEFFGQNHDPGLLVLMLELLAPIEDPRILDLARRAADHRADGVRLEALRIILDRRPLETPGLAKQRGGDYSLQVRLLLAERLVGYDRARAIDLAYEILDDESTGPRMGHALERVCELLVEIGGVDLIERLEVARQEYGDEDVEDYLDWALSKLREAG